jgi:hypothetical protein
MKRGIIKQAHIERADTITLVIKRTCLAVGARRDKIAIFGIEEKNEPEENGQQSFIKMLWSARRQGFGTRPISGMETSKQLMQCAKNLRGEPCRDLCLRVPAGFEE